MKFIKSIAIYASLIGAFYLGRYFYFLPKFSDGEAAPGFQAELIDGAAFSLADHYGNYILLDFWGSWCGPCRAESPSLVSLYKDYNDKHFKNAEGFKIISVAIETNEKRWKQAIKKDNLDWPFHIVQLNRFSSPIAKQYGVREIPTKYLLDTNGEILKVNPSFEALRSFLDEEIDN